MRLKSHTTSLWRGGRLILKGRVYGVFSSVEAPRTGRASDPRATAAGARPPGRGWTSAGASSTRPHLRRAKRARHGHSRLMIGRGYVPFRAKTLKIRAKVAGSRPLGQSIRVRLPPLATGLRRRDDPGRGRRVDAVGRLELGQALAQRGVDLVVQVRGAVAGQPQDLAGRARAPSTMSIASSMSLPIRIGMSRAVQRDVLEARVLEDLARRVGVGHRERARDRRSARRTPRAC